MKQGKSGHHVFCAPKQKRNVQHQHQFQFSLNMDEFMDLFGQNNSRPCRLSMRRSFCCPHRSGLHGHAFKVHQQRCKTRRRQHGFRVRMVPYWNKLPEKIVNASSVETFKLRLDAEWQSSSQNFPSNPSRTCSSLSFPTLMLFL